MALYGRSNDNRLSLLCCEINNHFSVPHREDGAEIFAIAISPQPFNRKYLSVTIS